MATVSYITPITDRTREDVEYARLHQNDLKNKILYLDLSNYKGDTNDKYTINDMNITSVPNISVFKNGKLDDIYVIDVDGYNMEKIISYLILKGE